MSLIESILAVTCPFIYILLLTGLFIYLFRKKLNFQAALPIALLSATIFIFLTTAVFHSIAIGFWITAIASLAFIPLVLRDKDRSRVLKELVFTPGFAIFFLLYIFLIALDWFKVVPLLSDTSMHWAPHVWAMWLQDDFYTTSGLSIVNHGDYPPAIQLFEVIFSKAAGVYHEGLLFVAMQLLGFSMIIATFDKFIWKKQQLLKQWGVVLLVTIAVILIPMVFFVSDFYFSLEVDAILGIVFAYGVYVATTESKTFTLAGLLKMSLVVTFLCLTKQIAVLLAGLVILIYLSGLLLSYRKIYKFSKVVSYFKKWQKSWKVILLVFALLILPVLSLKIWSHQIKGYVSPDPGIAIFHLKPLDALQIPSIFLGHSGSEAQQYFSHAFISHILFDPGGFLLNNLNVVSYMQVALLFVGIMAIVWLITKDKDARKRIAIVAAVVFAGWFLYCFAIYCVFLFGGMKPVEMMGNDVSNRYLRTYLFAMLIIGLVYLFRKLIDDLPKPNIKPVMYFIAILLIIFGLLFNKGTVAVLGLQSIGERQAEFARLDTHRTQSSLFRLASMAGTFEKPSTVLVTAESDNERHYLQYSALPNRVALLLFEKGTTQKSVCDQISAHEYFIIGYSYPDKNNWTMIRNCLPANTNLVPGNIYKITNSNNRVSLKRL